MNTDRLVIGDDVWNRIAPHLPGKASDCGDSEFNVTLSCGIAEFPAFDTGPELSEAADKALYEAKSSGRNKVVLAKAR